MLSEQEALKKAYLELKKTYLEMVDRVDRRKKKVQRELVNWEDVRDAIKYIERLGGKVVNEHGKERTFTLPPRPGIRTLGKADLLINWGGFRRVLSEEEFEELNDIRFPERWWKGV